MKKIKNLISNSDHNFLQSLIDEVSHPVFIFKKNQKNYFLFTYNKSAKSSTENLIQSMIQKELNEIFPDIDMKILFNEIDNLYKGISKIIYLRLFCWNKKKKSSINIKLLLPNFLMITINQTIEKDKNDINNLRIYHSSLIDHISDAIITTDIDFQIISWNKAAEEIYGWKSSEVLGKNVHEVLKTKIPQSNKEKETQNFIDEKFWRGIAQQKTKKGNSIYISNSTRLVENSKGNFSFIVAINRDITEQIKAAEKLEKSEQRFKLLFNNATDAIFWINVASETIIECNKAAMNILKRNKKEIIGKHFTFLHPPESKRKYQNLFEFNRREGSCNKKEIYLYSKSGHLIPVILSTSIASVGSKEILQMIFHDISYLKEADQKSRRFNKLKTQFLRRISHELKTPLIAVKGYTDLSLSYIYDTKNKFVNQFKKNLIEIKKGYTRLEDIIGKLIKSSELTLEDLEPHYKFDDLVFLIKYCIKKLQNLAEKRMHILKTDLHEKIITRFEKEAIHDVICNLLTNAIKYTAPGGIIIIQTEIEEDNIIVSVKDNGIGVTKKERNILFKKFGKIERYGLGYDLEIDGTGLGLYISRKLIEAHNGEIWMTSKGRNRGSTFYFSLPLIKEIVEK